MGSRRLADMLGAQTGGPGGRRQNEPNHSPVGFWLAAFGAVIVTYLNFVTQKMTTSVIH